MESAPKKRNVEPCPTDDVRSHKTVYEKEKCSKLQHINNWDCRPRRMIDPNKARKLRESLCIIEKTKLMLQIFSSVLLLFTEQGSEHLRKRTC